MLPSLSVKNYRNLKELSIESLGRINLIAGKNNTGKSSLLEAVYLYANKGNLDSIFSILEQRGEYIDNTEKFQNEQIKVLSSLFYSRSYSLENKIEIKSKDSLSLKFVSQKAELIKMTIEGEPVIDYQLALEINMHNFSRFFPFTKNLYTYTMEFETSDLFDFIKLASDPNQFIHTNQIDRDINSTLFDGIALTDKEHYVIEALQIIEPKTERIAFVNKGGKERTAVIKLSDSKEIIPLGSMGDGINRLLTVILALVNCSDGYLFIDEFENGLHYTVQEQLWDIIFKLSSELNIQVFATTHSNDCISAFSKILNKEEYKSLGKYIRLDCIDGVIKEVSFSPEELNIADEQQIEIR